MENLNPTLSALKGFYSAIFVWLILSSASFAQSDPNDLPKNVSYASIPNWVSVQDYDAKAFEGEAVDGSAYLLVSFQRHLSESDDDRHSRIVQRLPTQDTVEEESQFSIEFDPSYQSLKLHHLRVIRNGVVQDRLNSPDFETDFRQVNVETETDRLIYNGTIRLRI